MRFGTATIFVAAFLCAAIGALLVRSALMTPSAEPAAAQVQSNAMAMKSVVVAMADLKAGDKLTPAMVRESGWPADMLPKGSFVSREALFRGEERTLSAPVAENEPILAQMLATVDGGLTGRLHDGMRGVTIRVNEASSVGGFVQPDDRVDVLLTQTDRAPEASTVAPRAYTRTLIRNVRVLATDQQTQRRQQTQPPKTVTLEVNEEDAKRLTLAGAIGQLSLTLNKGKGESGWQVSRSVDSRDIAGLADFGAPESPVVAIFRSVERKEYRVPQE